MYIATVLCVLATFGLQDFYVFYYSKDGSKKDDHFNFAPTDPQPKGVKFQNVAQRVPLTFVC
jgi:hypothetical protein